MNKPSHYQSYLLRLWRDSPRAAWQGSLQSTATGQLHLFSDVHRMWAFLQTQLAAEGWERGEEREVDEAPPDESERGASD